jgi:protein-tyrosine phosphatase
MPAPIRILFVCLGNICRSPAGENVMRHVVTEAGVDKLFTIDSAGTANYHTGNSPDSRMRKAAKERDLPMTGAARQVQPQDFTEFDLILAMDRSNLRDLQGVRARCKSPTAALHLFSEFCTKHQFTDTPDPYCGDAADFHHVLDLMEDGCANILELWRKGELPGA